MRHLFLTTLILFSFLLSAAQPWTARKSSRTENKVVYGKRSLLIFDGQWIEVKSHKTKGRINDMKFADSTESRIRGINDMSNTIMEHGLAPTLCIDFKSLQTGEGKTMSVLLVKNPFDMRLSYKAKIYSIAKRRYIRVKRSKIVPGLTGVQTWTEPVSKVILYKFKVSRE